MTWWQAIILGLIQGLTEFLPVSSSGHLVLAEKIMNIQGENFITFYSFLHMGTLIAVFVVMRKEVLYILKNIMGRLTWLLVASTVPAVLFALLFNDLIESSFDGAGLGVGFIFTSALLMATLLVKEGDKPIKKMSWLDAILAGIGQAIAILPSVSRSGSSLAALLFRNFKREAAIRYVFLMSIPAILGSFLLDIIKIIKGDVVMQPGQTFNIILGVIVAGLSGYFAMAFMLKKLNRKGILICGIYVGALGALLLLDQLFFHVIMK